MFSFCLYGRYSCLAIPHFRVVEDIGSWEGTGMRRGQRGGNGEGKNILSIFYLDQSKMINKSRIYSL